MGVLKMRFSRFLLPILAFLIAACAAPMTSHREPNRTTASPPAKFIMDAQALLTVAENSAVSDSEFENRLRSMFDHIIDLNAAAQKITGDRWQQANEAQQKEFVVLLKERLLKTAVDKRTKFKELKIEFKGFRTSLERDRGELEAMILWTDGDKMRLLFLMVPEENDSWRTRDFVVEGVSLLGIFGYQGLLKPDVTFQKFLEEIKRIEKEKDEKKKGKDCCLPKK